MTVRTRFAPSPTGYIHVGNVRAALFPWLLARQTGGSFVLRIEDTDQARFVEGATDLILDTLDWLGIDWDEGPRVGGEYGPHVQTGRRGHYRQHAEQPSAWDAAPRVGVEPAPPTHPDPRPPSRQYAEQLIAKGLAYADPYTPEEVQAFREEAKALKKPFLYRDHRPENPPAWDVSQPLRFKVTDIKRYTWDDPVMGELSAGPEVLDDFILVKSDGLPTYNFAHIVDDAEMGITHVIRGLEYISSIPRYLSLYEALEITPPVLACLPHIMAPDGKKKLGKRDGAKSVEEYKVDGILPEAMLNFLASMGWNDGTEQEIFSRDELIEKFSLERVQRSGARFDERRLLWMNGEWIRRLSLDELYDRVERYWPHEAEAHDAAYKQQVLALVQERLKTLAELPLMTRYFFAEPVINLELITGGGQLKKLSSDEVKSLLTAAHEALAALSDWTPEAIQDCLNQLLETTGQKPGTLFSLIRIATTWAPFSPQLNDTLALLGQQKTLDRIALATQSI